MSFERSAMAASSCCRASERSACRMVDHRLTLRHLGLQLSLLDLGLRARLLCGGVGFGCRALHERVNHPGHAGLARLNRRVTRTFDERLLDGGERTTPLVVVQSGRFVLSDARSCVVRAPILSCGRMAAAAGALTIVKSGFGDISGILSVFSFIVTWACRRHRQTTRYVDHDD